MDDREIRAALDRHWAASDANDFETEHVRCRESVFEAMRAAGVLGNVAADAAHRLRRRVGGVEIFLR